MYFKNLQYNLYKIDHTKNYLNVFSKFSYHSNIDYIYRDLLQGTEHIACNEYNYSTFPLTLGKIFDIIIIDGRRRVECAYIASLISNSETFILLHDAWRIRYKALEMLFYKIKYTKSHYCLMKLRPEIYNAYKSMKQPKS